MKLGKKYLFSVLFTTLFMIFITSLTIKHLYNNNNITKEEYLKLLLSDTYGDNFYINLVEMINRNFNPINIIELKEVKNNNFNLHNKIDITSPKVYIYNEINKEYEEEYNVKPNLFLATYLLSENLNNVGIESIFESNNIEQFSNNNNLSIEQSLNIFINDKKNTYPSIEYIINLGMSDTNYNTTIKIEDKRYALISLYANLENISFMNKLNSKLNEKYNGISKIYIDNSYNGSMKIDFGNKKNTMKEVLNSILVFSNIFMEVI